MTDDQKERLTLLLEECAEVQIAVTKIFRFGPKSQWTGETNESALRRELSDLMAAIKLICDNGDFDITADELIVRAEEKQKKMKKFCLHDHWKGIENEQHTRTSPIRRKVSTKDN